jgi:hypothetical protein
LAGRRAVVLAGRRVASASVRSSVEGQEAARGRVGHVGLQGAPVASIPLFPLDRTGRARSAEAEGSRKEFEKWRVWKPGETTRDGTTDLDAMESEEHSPTRPKLLLDEDLARRGPPGGRSFSGQLGGHTVSDEDLARCCTPGHQSFSSWLGGYAISDEDAALRRSAVDQPFAEDQPFASRTAGDQPVAGDPPFASRMSGARAVSAEEKTRARKTTKRRTGEGSLRSGESGSPENHRWTAGTAERNGMAAMSGRRCETGTSGQRRSRVISNKSGFSSEM